MIERENTLKLGEYRKTVQKGSTESPYRKSVQKVSTESQGISVAEHLFMEDE